MKQHVSAAPLFGVLLVAVPIVLADPMPVGDYDKRAAATLISASTGAARTPDSISAEEVRSSLTRFEKSPDGKRTIYVLNFGALAVDGTDSRGYYRITVGEALPDAAQGGWTLLRVDEASGAEIHFKRVERTDADKYLNIAARKQIGGVILTISQRRSFSETNEAAAKQVNEWFINFEATGRRYGLFGDKLKVEYAVGADRMLPLEAGQPIRIRLNTGGSTQLALRVSVVDSENRPLDLAKFRGTVRLSGELARYALKSDGAAAAEQQFDQPGREPVRLQWTFPPPADKAFGPALEKSKGATTDFSVDVEVHYTRGSPA